MFWAKKGKAGKRHILLHYHIFKNAGTTIYFILRSNFGKRVASLDSNRFNRALSDDALLEFLQKHPKIEAVTSHHLFPPKPQHEEFVFHDILFLRHPLARLSSMYDFYRRTDVTEDPLTKEARRRTTADFMRLLMDKYPHHVNNAQVMYLSARERNAAEPELKTAVRIALQSTALGLAEQFDVSAVTAEESLSPVFKGIRFAYIARNVSSSGPRELQVHLSHFQDACGDQIYEQLLKLNLLDIALLEEVKREVEQRFRMIRNHEERLRNFITWRSALDPGSMALIVASNPPADFTAYANAGTV